MIRFLIKIYILLIVVDAILSYIPQFRGQPWAKTLRKWANYSLDPVRKFLPPDLPLDLSPLVVIFVLNLIMFFW